MFGYKLFSVAFLNVFRKNRCFYSSDESHPLRVSWFPSLYLRFALFSAFSVTLTLVLCMQIVLGGPHSIQDHASSHGTHSSFSFGNNFIWAKMVFLSHKNVIRLHFLHPRKEKKPFTWWLALVLELLRQIPNDSNWRGKHVLFLVKE